MNGRITSLSAQFFEILREFTEGPAEAIEEAFSFINEGQPFAELGT